MVYDLKRFPFNFIRHRQRHNVLNQATSSFYRNIKNVHDYFQRLVRRLRYPTATIQLSSRYPRRTFLNNLRPRGSTTPRRRGTPYRPTRYVKDSRSNAPFSNSSKQRDDSHEAHAEGRPQGDTTTDRADEGTTSDQRAHPDIPTHDGSSPKDKQPSPGEDSHPDTGPGDPTEIEGNDQGRHLPIRPHFPGEENRTVSSTWDKGQEFPINSTTKGEFSR